MLSQTSTTLLNSLLEEPADQRAWRTFVERYGPAVVRFARRRGLDAADADEVLSGTLGAFFESYRAGKYDRGRGRFRTWVFGIAAIKVREVRRVKGRHRRAEFVEGLAAGSVEKAAGGVDAGVEGHAGPSADAQFDADVDWTIAWQCLEAVRRQVTPLTYQAFDLYAIQGLRPEEIARTLGIKREKVYVAKNRVIKRARELCAELCAEE